MAIIPHRLTPDVDTPATQAAADAQLQALEER